MSLTKKMLLFDAIPLVACLATLWMMHYHQPNKVPIPFKAPPESVVVSSIDRVNNSDTVKRTQESPQELKKDNRQKRKLSHSVFRPGGPDTIPYLAFDPMMLQAMYEQANFLRRSDTPVRGASGISKSDMLRTVELLQSVQLLDPNVLHTTFDFYSINTDLKKDKVRVTGYYTPLIKASRVQTPEFPVPMLRRPESVVPSPAAIEAGALACQGLELACLPS